MHNAIDLIGAVANGQLRLGIAMSRFTAYVELNDREAGSQNSFQYSITCDGQRLYIKTAATFDAARKQAEADLRALCAASHSHA